MGRRRKLLERILNGRSDANIPFEQTRTLLKSLGFSEDIEGDSSPRARSANRQVRQIRKVLVDYDFKL